MFNKYPYTDFHELNTDWIIGKIKNVETAEANTKQYAEDADAAKIAAEDARDIAVSAKDTAVQAKDDAVDAKNTAQNIVTSTQQQITLLQARVDNIIPDGTQTAGNTELLDIRVGADGTIYDSAGDAVRAQFTDVADKVNALAACDINAKFTRTQSTGGTAAVFNGDMIEIPHGGYVFYTLTYANMSDFISSLRRGVLEIKFRCVGLSAQTPQDNTKRIRAAYMNGTTFTKSVEFTALDNDYYVIRLSRDELIDNYNNVTFTDFRIRLDNRSYANDFTMVLEDVSISDGIYVQEESEFAVVATDGDDITGNGSAAHPFATVARAINSGHHHIRLKGGVYGEQINLRDLYGEYVFSAYDPTARPVFMQASAAIVQSESPVPGYSNIYSASLASLGDSYYWLFQNDVWDTSTLISDSERHPLERGQEYRCEDTKIIKCNADNLGDALTEIETSADYRFFYDSDTQTLYFSRPASVDSDHPICCPTTRGLFTNGNKNISLKLYGIVAKYMNINIDNTVGSELVDCKAIEMMNDGAFTYDVNLGGKFIRCEASRCHFGITGDGFNGHSNNTGDPFSKHTTIMMIDCWSHDNNDDGYSDHERSETTIIGGLYEYNGKAGVTPSYGSHCTCYNTVSRHNDSGFLYVGAVDPAEGGKYGQMLCNSCVAEDNVQAGSGYGFGVRGAGNTIKLINCKSLRNNIGYNADASTGAELIDCGSCDDLQTRGGSGIIAINNTTLVI